MVSQAFKDLLLEVYKAGKEEERKETIEWIKKRAYRRFTTDMDLHLNYRDYYELKERGTK